MSKEPIFIGGLMKSGTSLLRKLISLHPNVFGGLETHWFSDDFKNNWQSGASTRQKWLMEFFEVTESDANKLRNDSNSSNDFFNRFMNFCAKRAGKERWVEKTPDNVFHINDIFESWPESRVLIMKRNLLDVYASWKKNNKSDLSWFLQTAEQYNAVVAQYASNEQVSIVRYDELVTHPGNTLKKVLHFIGEDYIEGLENYQGDESDYKKVLSVTGKVSPTTESLAKPIFTSSLGGWKEVLTEEEVEKIITL